jgi:hypothetical protein
MPEIFGRVPLEFGGGFAADAANVFFGTACFGKIDGGGQLIKDCNVADQIPFAGVGLITQNMNFQYQQPINRIFEVGGSKSYYVAGRPQGNASLGRIVGPRPITVAFYTLFGNVCQGPLTSLMFAGAAGCQAKPVIDLQQNGFAFMLDGALLQSIGISVTAQDMVINEQLQFMFISLLVQDPVTGQF